MQVKITRFFAAGLNLGLIPKITLPFYGEAKIWYQEYDVYGRVHPFGGAFFLGAGLGYARVSGSILQSVNTSQLVGLVPRATSTLDVTSEGVVKTMVLTPQMGFFKTFKIGFSFGVDVGLQVPVAPSDVTVTTTIPSWVPKQYVTQYVKPEEDKVGATLETVGRTLLPVANFRMGWLL